MVLCIAAPEFVKQDQECSFKYTINDNNIRIKGIENIVDTDRHIADKGIYTADGFRLIF